MTRLTVNIESLELFRHQIRNLRVAFRCRPIEYTRKVFRRRVVVRCRRVVEIHQQPRNLSKWFLMLLCLQI